MMRLRLAKSVWICAEPSPSVNGVARSVSPTRPLISWVTMIFKKVLYFSFVVFDLNMGFISCLGFAGCCVGFSLQKYFVLLY